MSVETALEIWEGLQAASPHGCRIHIGGGEPFGRWERLIELARRAQAAGLGPLEAVETNAFWATDEEIVRERVAALDAAGMGRLTISADPYHQQFVPLDRVRLAGRVAGDVLGPDRVRIRWADWAEDGCNTDKLPADERERLFAEYAASGRDRIAGRAAKELSGCLQLMSPAAFADKTCSEPLLRSNHVHADGDGLLCPGTCAGIVLGRARKAEGVGNIWRSLADRFAETNDSSEGFEVIAALSTGGPVALMDLAAKMGYKPLVDGYAAKCHLCWHVRRWLFDNGLHPGQLGPENIYCP